MSVTRVDLGAHHHPDGSLNWSAYRDATIANGETCWQCERGIVHPVGNRSLCFECNDLITPDECDHEKYVRCPKCGTHWDPYETEDYNIWAEHDAYSVLCEECEYLFTVRVMVTYNITSPERLSVPPAPEGK